jgi:hypothetical protein
MGDGIENFGSFDGMSDLKQIRKEAASVTHDEELVEVSTAVTLLILSYFHSETNHYNHYH